MWRTEIWVDILNETDYSIIFYTTFVSDLFPGMYKNGKKKGDTGGALVRTQSKGFLLSVPCLEPRKWISVWRVRCRLICEYLFVSFLTVLMGRQNIWVFIITLLLHIDNKIWWLNNPPHVKERMKSKRERR